MTNPLASRRCVPCRGDTPPLTPDEQRTLAAALGGDWTIEAGHHLTRTYTFPDFRSGLAFVNRVAEVAETEGHHPDIELAWGRVKISVWTHAIDGLTESDFILAAKADAVRDG